MLPAVFSGCTQNDILYDVDYNVTFDPSNTYLAGDPVKFNFTGEVDNILFYSGETGSEYRYRDRYTIPVEEVTKATLRLDVISRYGSYAGGLDVYYTDKFSGLDRNDPEADRATIASMSGDMAAAGWTKAEVWTEDRPEQNSETPVSVEIPVTDLKENFCLAFHWHPTQGEDKKNAQRTYWVNGSLIVETQNFGTLETDLDEFLYTTVMMNDERENPYATANAEGNIRFDDSNYDIKFQGVAAGKLDYSLDGWCVSFPQAFNSIPNDKGVVIKNMQNYMSTYEYTYDEPGTYNAVFVGRNANYLGTNEKVKELSIIIMDKLYFGDDEEGTGSGATE